MCEIVKFDMNNPISLECSGEVKEELKDEYYADNKVCVSETTVTNTVNISNTELNECIKNEQIRNYETLFLDHIKTDISTPEANDTVINNVKIEDRGICSADRHTEFCNELLFCNHCHEVYQDYCTKCRVLVHILNKSQSHTAYSRLKELPKYMLEARESTGHLGIFSLKVIPEDVRFGPFTGLNSTELPLRIKEGRIMVSDDKLENLNWMQYINPAKNIYEQNLYPFQYDEKLYYGSTRRIQEGEELLVYFGKECEDKLLKSVEMDFVPITKRDVENVFACIFCCLGFSSKEYLAEHKATSHSETNKIFSVEELTQCPFCKIYLEAKEYFEHHMDYCCETNHRYSVHSTPMVHKLEAERRSSERQKAKKWKRGIYKCTQCKFRTIYSADFRRHANEHYEIKMYKCEICDRRYKTKQSLKAHVKKNHGDNDGMEEKFSTCDYFKANIKNIKHTHDGEKQCQCTKCKFQTKDKCHLKTLKHLNRDKYKCENCEYKTYYSTYLERHVKTKHLMKRSYKCSECDFETKHRSSLVKHKHAKHLKTSKYKCTECDFKTYYSSNLRIHIKGKHMKQNNYKCTECEFMTNYKSSLDIHVEAKHLKQNEYKCAECEFMTYYKSNLDKHIKRKHAKDNDYKCVECKFKTNYEGHLAKHIRAKHHKMQQNDYKCTECEFKTNYKSHLKEHIKSQHLKENDYKCTECEFRTYYKSKLQAHIKVKHLKQNDYKCVECEFKTNNKGDLVKHVKGKHLKQNDYKCTECEFKTSYKSSLDLHIEARHLKENFHKCTECEFKTNYKSSLQLHIKGKHLKLNDYKCLECEYMTSRKSYLTVHIKTKHLKENDYKCTECEFKTMYKANLERHVKDRHLKQDYGRTECAFKL